ncbi:MAG: methylenetetrahydrofolate reductase [Desulfobacteraceae bacterium]|nr:MAG: methylenetetrahydrofolate reductase [Desulfobacteraceae bacterium]
MMQRKSVMLRIFNHEIQNPDHFVVTVELVPARESGGRTTDTIVGIAKDAFSDGRVCAVSITDNPGGNPSLSPDVLGYEIYKHGLDVIVHFTCRDMNRMGMESRALQLARMGMKNILALTGDYSGKGFGGQGKPVFDLDSTILCSLLRSLNGKLIASGDPEEFFFGCAVSPFKTTEAECRAQYTKLDRKIEAGASFVITQLGYDAEKYSELMTDHQRKGHTVPVLGSAYLLSPRSAGAMFKGKVPGAYLSKALYETVMKEWETPRQGLKAAIERTARLGVILKGLGYRGIHIGGVHKSFHTVGAILDRMDEIQVSWQDYLHEFNHNRRQTYYMFADRKADMNTPSTKTRLKSRLVDFLPYTVLHTTHNLFFNKNSPLAPFFRTVAAMIDRNGKAWLLKLLLEDPIKIPLLSCQGCGDCGIQHAAFLCPESGCPKHTRNGPCGGSREGYCEVNQEKLCIWVRAYSRLQYGRATEMFIHKFVPPRNWALNKTSSWINFHLGRDHQKEMVKK